MKFGFLKASRKNDAPTLQTQVASLSDLHELLKANAIAVTKTLTSPKQGRAARISYDFLQGNNETIVFECFLYDKELYNRMWVPEGTKTVQSRLVLKLSEPFSEEAYKNGTLKATVQEYILDGTVQDRGKPADLKRLVDYKREMDFGFVPVAVADRPAGYVPYYQRKKDNDGYLWLKDGHPASKSP